MQIKYINKSIQYTGAELASLFAYKNFGLQGDSVIAFCGACFVDIDNLIDQEDVRRKAFIRSAEMVHFIGEKFDLDLAEGVLRQRLYIALIKETLEALKPKLLIQRKGDDLFIDDQKLTVSIATLSPVSTLIHIGVNVSSKNTPVKTIGLADLGISKTVFAKKVLTAIQREELSMTNARCKVRGAL
jgi:uncharacterized protein